MVDMIADPEFLFYHGRHTGACPEVREETGACCALKEQFFEPRFAFSGKLGRTAEGGLCLEAFAAGFKIGRFPAARGASIDLELVCNINRLESILEQNDRLHTSLFQLLRAAKRAHNAPPAHSIGH